MNRKEISRRMRALAQLILLVFFAASLVFAIPLEPLFIGKVYGDACLCGVTTEGSIMGTPVPLTEKFRFNVQGDYVAAGIGLRNTGSGSITITLPSGCTIVKAFLYWAVMDYAYSTALSSGVFNGASVTGTLLGQTANPCWLGDIFNFRADVTSLAVAGINTVTLASGVTGPSPGNVVPSPATPPLLEGASLVVIFSHPAFAFREIIIHDGAVTFAAPPPVSTTFTAFTAYGSPPQAKTTWIVADGQHNVAGLNNRILVDGTGIASNVLDGAGPGTQLWDTRTEDISAFVPAGDTSVTVAIESTGAFTHDCLTWVAQVLSVTKQPPRTLNKKVYVELLENGDFSSGLDCWKVRVEKGNAVQVYDGPTWLATRPLGPGWTDVNLINEVGRTNVLDIIQTVSDGDGDWTGVYQMPNKDVTSFSELYFEADGKAMFQSLAGDGWVGGEYPVHFIIQYEDVNGVQHDTWLGWPANPAWQQGFYYLAGNLPNEPYSNIVTQNTWFHYKSPNLMNLSPAPKIIKTVRLYSSGWAYHGRIDNAQLYGTPPSAELGDVIHVEIEVSVPSGETVTVVDTLPTDIQYCNGTFTIDGDSATPTITENGPPPPIITEISYTITDVGTHTIEFDCKVDMAYWEDREICNVATATWYDEAGGVIDEKEAIACFTIHAFEEVSKSIDSGACGSGEGEYLYVDGYEPWIEDGWTNPGASLLGVPDGEFAESFDHCSMTSMYTFEDIDLAGRVVTNVELEAYSKCDDPDVDIDAYIFTYDEAGNPVMEWAWANSQGGTTDWAWTNKHYYCGTEYDFPEYYGDHILTEQGINSAKLLVHYWSPTGASLGSVKVDAYRLKVMFDPLTIKAETETQWKVAMEVTNPFSYTMKNVTIKDNFGAELEIDQVSTSPDINVDGVVDILDLARVAASYGNMAPAHPRQWDILADINRDGIVDARDLAAVTLDYGLTLWLTGKSDKVHLFWYIGDLAPGETARLILLVSTDLNPAGHQEYTEPGVYEMNSGATLKFKDYTGRQLSAVTDSIYVTVLPLEDP